MERITKSSLILAAILAISAIAAVSAEPDSQTFEGQYDWRDGGKDDLSVEFEPDGEGRWQVTFRFRFDGRANTWKGSAEGNLDNGSLVTGTASSGSRKWTWRAELEDDVMRGTHTELQSRNRTYETGTFVVRR